MLFRRSDGVLIRKTGSGWMDEEKNFYPSLDGISGSMITKFVYTKDEMEEWNKHFKSDISDYYWRGAECLIQLTTKYSCVPGGFAVCKIFQRSNGDWVTWVDDGDDCIWEIYWHENRQEAEELVELLKKAAPLSWYDIKMFGFLPG